LVLAQYRRVKLQIHPALLVVLCIFFFFYAKATCCILLSLLFHEGCHSALAARYGVKLAAIELLPCGGRVVFTEMDGLSSKQIVYVALAGPIGSLLLAFFLHHNEFLWQINLMLASFNLLPFLPLDGGNILKAILRDRCRPSLAGRALTALSLCGGTAMLFYALFMYYWRRNVEVSLLIMAIFILKEAWREYRLLRYTAARQSLRKMFAFAGRGLSAGKLYVADRETDILSVLKRIGPTDYGIIMVVNDSYRVVKVFSEIELWKQIEQKGSRLRFCDLLREK